MIIRESSAFETDPAVFNRPYHTSERAGASNLLCLLDKVYVVVCKLL